MSLASVIAGFRKRIQSLERGVGRLERRLGSELPPEWEAVKLAVNPLNLGYTPIVPLIFGSATCGRMKFTDGRLQVDTEGGTYGYTLFDQGSPRFTPFAGAKGWGIPYSPNSASPGFLVLWHQGMGMPVWLTGCAGMQPVWVGGWSQWWGFKWQREDAGEGWDPPLTWESPGCGLALLLNSSQVYEDIYYSLCTVQDWAEANWMYVVLQHTTKGFIFDSHLQPTFGTKCLSGQIPSFDWYAVRAYSP
jgi:hypothetical protein